MQVVTEKPSTDVSAWDLEQHLAASEWCHLYRNSYDIALCGIRIRTHEPFPWDGKDTRPTCPKCGNLVCVDCLLIVKGEQQ